MSTPSKWKYFSREELACACGCGHGEDMMDHDFMNNMVYLREECGFAWPVTSGYRCPEYNDSIYVKQGFAPRQHLDGPHTTGRAIDIHISREQAYIALQHAMRSGYVTGIGIRQHGLSRFLHFDDLWDTDGRPRPTIWSYK